MTRLFNNKKGAAEEMIYWFFYIPLTAAVIIILAISINGLLHKTTSTYNLEYQIYQKRVINTLSYRDEYTGRLYPGIIDPSRWNEQTLQNALNIFDEEQYLGEEFGIRLHMDYLDKIEPLSDIYYNKEGYDISKIFHMIEKEHYVLIISEDGLIQAKLEINLAYHRKRYPGENE